MLIKISQPKRQLLLIGIYLFIVIFTLYSYFGHWAYDDPFITYRYADNLTRGLGFVYNPGARVLSTTTPLFAMILAIFGIIWSNIPGLANLIGILSLGIGALCIWDLSKSWKTPWIGWAALLLYPTFPLLVSTIGSETPVYLALCLAAFAAYAREKMNSTALLCALAILCRPDAAIVPVILAVDFLWHRKPIPRLALVLFISVLLAWAGFASVYFGSPLPATLLAKQHQGLMTISQRFAPGLITILKSYARTWPYYIEAILGLLGTIWVISRRQPWSLILIWTLLYFISYTLLGVTRYFWYYAPLIPGGIVAIGAGVVVFIDLIKKLTIHLHILLRPLYGHLMVSGLLVIFVCTQAWNLWQMTLNPDNRYPIYHEVGTWLNENTKTSDKVGSLEVGIIGYYARRPMIDFAGLIQPQTAQEMTPSSTYDDTAVWAVNEYHPQYIVFSSGGLPLLENDYIKSHCQIKKTFSGQDYHYTTDILVAECPN